MGIMIIDVPGPSPDVGKSRNIDRRDRSMDDVKMYKVRTILRYLLIALATI